MIDGKMIMPDTKTLRSHNCGSSLEEGMALKKSSVLQAYSPASPRPPSTSPQANAGQAYAKLLVAVAVSWNDAVYCGLIKRDPCGRLASGPYDLNVRPVLRVSVP
jgi:hypothetical protein